MIPKLLANIVSPGGPKASLSILIFHRIPLFPDPLYPDEPDAKQFRAILTWLKKSFEVISLGDAASMLAGNNLPPRAVAITFDDGYRDNFSVATPILKEHGLDATFFIATGFLDGGCMWNDVVAESVRQFGEDKLDLSSIGLGMYDTSDWTKKRVTLSTLLASLKYLPTEQRSERCLALADLTNCTLPSDIMMTSAELKSMRTAGMSIGAHTRTHPILTSVDDHTALEEIRGSKFDLESLLDEEVNLFAYPNGRPGQDYSSTHVEMVKNCGFSAAVSTAIGASNSNSDKMQLPRFTPWDKSEYRFCLRLLRNTAKKVKVT